MTVKLIQSHSDFLALKGEWNALLDRSASRVPFLRHEFLASWWETGGGGEWEQRELAVLLHQDSARGLYGIAPFFRSGDTLLFLGSHEISDYLDLIASPEDLPAVVEDTASFLQSDRSPAWRTLDLYNLLEDSASLPLLREAARHGGWELKEDVLTTAPFIPLPASWEDFLGSLQDRYRRDLEKKLAAAENYFLPVSWYIAEDAGTLEQELDDFLGLMANDPRKKRFLTQEMVRQQKLAVREAFQGGWLQLAFLQVGEIKAAGILNFDFDGQIWVYNSGINTLFENISPGWVLLGHLIRWAIAAGRSTLDFMRGDEAYKYQFGGIDKQVRRLQIRH